MQDSRPLPVDVPVDAPAMDGRMAGATDAVDDVAEDLRFSFAGERVDGEAGAAFLEQLEQAKAREQADEDAQEIRRSTGWERGLDGMWRLEVSDERAHLKESRFVNAWLEGRAVPRGMLSRKDQSRLRDLQERLEDLEGRVFAAPAAERQTAQWDALFDEYRAVNDEVENLLRLQRGELRYLEDVLEHPELFALYPQARRIWVSLLLDKTPSEEWSPRMEGSLTMGLGVDGPDFSLAKIRLVAGNREQMLSGLLHEVQHAIQLYEGFAEGDSTANYLPPSPESGERMRRLVALDDAARERQVAPEQFAALAGYEPEVVQRVQELVSRSLWEQNVQDWRTSLLTPFQRYRRAAGEVEARNVQTRMGMTQEQRRDTPPQQTEDVAREDQFVLHRRSRMEAGAALGVAGEVRNEMRNEAPDDGVRDGSAPSVMEELLEQARQMREQREALVQDLQQQLEAGQMPVFHDPEGLNSGGLVLTLSPSAQREGWVQVTRYNDSGMLGDGQYKSVDEAVRGDMLHRMRKMRPQQAQEVMQRLVEAEMRYQGVREQASGEQAEAVAPSMAAGMTTGAGMAVAARPRRQPRPSAQVDQIREALRSQYGDLVDALESRGHLVLAGSARETLELLARRHAQLHDKPVEWARARLRGLNVDTTALQGFFDRETGVVFMVADHLTRQTAAPVLLHEMGVHMRYALKQKDARLGPLFRGMFIRARRMVMEPGGDPLLQQVQQRMLAVGVMTRAQLARGEFSGEEAAAYIAELHAQQPGVGGRGVRAWMGRLVAGVRAWLYERTGLLRTSSMRPADIAAIARAGLGDVAGRGRARDDSGQPPGVLPSMAAGQVEDDPPQPVASPVASPVSEGAASDQDDQDQGGNQKGGAKEGEKAVSDPAPVISAPGLRLAPNGKPSNLAPHLYAMVRTREFKEWFGDWEHDPQNASRVLDRNGEPAVLYHGSRESGFTEFDAGMIKNGGGFFLTDSSWLAGSYSGTLDSAPLFTPAQLLENPGLLAGLTIDEGILVQVEYEDHYGYTELRWEWYEDKESALEALELAEGEELVIRSPGYLMETPEGDVFKGDRQELLQELSALRAEPQPGLYEVFVNLRDVLDVDWMGNSWLDGSQGPAEQVWNVVGADGIVLATYRDEDSAQEALDEEAGERIEMENQPLYEHSHDVSWAAQSMGCDGAILRNVVDPGSYGHGGEDGDVYIAFHPGAIKWIDNEGSFDRRNDDIRFSLRPLSGASASDEDVVDGRETAAMMDAMEGVMSENQQVQEQDRVLEQNALEQDAGIQDFGEKLGGARKDVWQERTQQMMLRISDYEVANHNLSEAWPRPDYDRLIESGMSSLDVAHVRALRDILEARPRSSSGWHSTYKLGVWAQDVILLRGMAADLLSGRLGWQDVASQLRMRTGDDMPEHRIDRIGYLAGLYNLAGHEADLSDIVRYRVRQGVGDDPALQEYRYYSSKKIKSGPLQGESVDVRGVGAEGALAAFDQMLQKQRALLEQQQARAATEAATEAAEGGVGAQGEQADGKPTRGRGKEYEAKDFPCYREAGPKAREGIFIGRYIGKSMACLAGPFDKLIPALEWRLDNVAELNERLRKYRDIPSERGEKNEPRSGLAYRDAGQGVEPQEFLDAFGFRGVEFGNWVSQSRRQKDLDQAHDALQDMCRVLGLDSTSVGLGNRLGLAFGARGLGGRNGVAAHYESDHTAINLTKTSGAGSLAHEWWHALDQHMVRVATRDASKYAFGTQTGVPCHQYEEYSDLHRFVERLRHQLSGALRTRSLELDSRRTNRYFSLPEELSARAFEGWIKWELEQLGERNDYLVNIRDEPDWEKRAEMGMSLDNSYPYPTRQEMPALAETFREIVRAACEAGILKPAEAAQEQQPEAVRQRQAAG